MKDRDSLIERAAAGKPASARLIWQDKKKRRGKAPLRARPSPPLDERTEPAPEPPDLNEILAIWKRATSFERRAFVSKVRDELQAILRVLDAAARYPAPSFSGKKSSGPALAIVGN